MPYLKPESLFQSTLSVRRATYVRVLTSWGLSISIHALRKESDHHEVVVPVDPVISIHALRKESD